MNFKNVLGWIAIILIIAAFLLFMTFPGCSGDYGAGKSGLTAPPAGSPTVSVVTPSSGAIST